MSSGDPPPNGPSARAARRRSAELRLARFPLAALLAALPATLVLAVACGPDEPAPPAPDGPAAGHTAPASSAPEAPPPPPPEEQTTAPGPAERTLGGVASGNYERDKLGPGHVEGNEAVAQLRSAVYTLVVIGERRPHPYRELLGEIAELGNADAARLALELARDARIEFEGRDAAFAYTLRQLAADPDTAEVRDELEKEIARLDG